ncbi:MAG: hypothetical protein ACE5EO_10440 [Candidatus Krumholzibacteriia bacterium]
MIDKKTEQLMWQDIDGTITPEDKKRLERFMVEQAGTREHYNDLVQFSALLGEVEEIDPGPTLRDRVEAAIDPNRYSTAPAAGRGTSFTWFGLRPNFRYAAAIAAGLLVGVIGYHLVNYGALPDKGKLAGSLRVNNSGTIMINDDGTWAAALHIDLDTVQGTIGLHVEGDLAISKVEVASEREVDITLAYQGQSLVTHLGSGRYYAVFQREGGAASPLSVRIAADGQVLLEEQVFSR